VGAPQVVYIPIPFWFSKPGVTSHALPIDALNADLVRIHVSFRPIEDLYYTDARMDNRTVGFRAGTDVEGEMPALQGGRFWMSSSDTSSDRVYSMNSNMPSSGIPGALVPGITLPSRFDMGDTYMIGDYISLEELESIAMRTAELTYHVEQHNVIQVQATQGATEVRIPLPLQNPTKELLWVCQRPEAETYNAWFLFTRDLSQPLAYKQEPNPCLVPWWPNADFEIRAVTDWQVLPAFRTANSEPVRGAALYYNSFERFVHEGPSLFRSLLPTLYATKAPVHDRYIYMWPFGYGGTTGGNYEPQGAANWDKIPRKEMILTMNPDSSCLNRPNMNIYVWTTVWNVFKVYGGRGAMLFAT
jgi:hypothetical protein